MSFASAYCQSPLCVPSRLSFHTGRLPYELEAWGNGRNFPIGIPTLQGVLSDAGYDTVGLGKLHFRDGGLHGFDRRPIGDRGAVLNFKAAVLSHAKQHGTTPFGQHPSEACEAPWPLSAEPESLTTDAAIRVLREVFERPFFLVVSYPKPHFPFVAARGYLDRYIGRGDVPVVLPEELDQLPESCKALREKLGLADLTDDQIRRARETYWANISFVDDCMSRVLGELTDLGILDDTLVMYVSDHGEMLGEKGLWYKSCFYEDAVRVPWLMRFPGRLPAGVTIPDPVGLVDLFPTVLRLLDLDPTTHTLDGQDVSCLAVDSRGGGAPRAILSEYYAKPLRVAQRMVRKGRFKYWWAEGDDERLFDLEADPRERRNLAGLESHEAVVAELRAIVMSGWDRTRFERFRERRRRKRSGAPPG